MENYHDIVAVKLHGDQEHSTRQKKVTERTAVALRIKDTDKNREIFIYNGIQKYILDALIKEL